MKLKLTREQAVCTASFIETLKHGAQLPDLLSIEQDGKHEPVTIRTCNGNNKVLACATFDKYGRAI